MLIAVLGVSIAVSALFTLRAAYGAPRRWFYLFKPLTTTLILFIALATPLLGWNTYAAWVAAGLACSLVGDVFLMLPPKRFVWGLVSFLAAHLCYIVAFTGRAGFRESPWLSLPFLVAGFILARQVAARARRLRWPCTLYIVVLMVMTWRACAAWAVLGSLSALLAGIGAVLFSASDITLAVNRFVRRFRWAQVVILSTYYAAQTLMAWSTWPAYPGESLPLQ